MIRLAYGLVAGRDLGVWASGPDGVAVDARRVTVAPGSAVVLGPRTAAAGRVAAALEALRELVARGGPIVAGADIDLGGGFRTGRLADASGDRRDAVLAALRTLGPHGAPRLGDRARVLVALFGPAATKRVGIAAANALHDGRWSALHLASAASDLLGPEQLERVLALPADGDERGHDQPYGLASTLAADLAQVLAPYPRPRRLSLLLDLHSVVAAQRAAVARRKRLRVYQHPGDRIDRVRQRYERHLEQQVLAWVRPGAGPIDLARWIPDPWHWELWFTRAALDALAATVLLRTAIAIAEDGLEPGLDRMRPLFAAGPRLLSDVEKAAASRPVAGLARVPARPGVYVRDIDERLRRAGSSGPGVDGYVRQRVALARDYGLVILDSVRDLLAAWQNAGGRGLGVHWRPGHLRPWREIAGYTEQRPPPEWQQPVLGPLMTEDAPVEDPAPLAQRLREQPQAAASDLEAVGDLLWLAELADALAQIDGIDAATVEYREEHPEVSIVARHAEPEPLRPVADSVPRAVAGVAALVGLGAATPPKPRGWAELVDAIMASTVVVEALTGAFEVPRVILDHDGATIPGTDLRLDVARDPHQLVAWAQYMGNCIAGPYYLGQALRGRSVLAALVGPGNRIQANVELRPRRTGWEVEEFQARFNNEPPAALDRSLRAWVATLAPARPPRAPAPPRHRPADHRPFRPGRELADLRHALTPLAAQALETDEIQRALDVLGTVSGAPAGGIVAVTALRRVGRGELDDCVRRALAAGLDVLDLWRSTAARPLASALAGLDPHLRSRTPQLTLLLDDEPLPALPRRLARTTPINTARTVEVVARRLRRSLGRLACGDDRQLAAHVPRQADTGLLCALVLTVSTAARPTEALTPITRAGQTDVPGFPESTVDDPGGPWRRARADATELGARLPRGRSRPALLVPTSWLGRGGWPALWSRAHRRNPRSH